MWQSAADLDDQRVRYALDQGLPEGVILGVYFSAELRAIAPETVEVIRNWFRGLTECIAPARQLAIILHLDAAPTEWARKVAARLRDSLPEGYCAPAMPVEIMCLDPWPQADAPAARLDGTWANIRGDDADDRAGLHLYSWFKEAADNADSRGDDISGREEYRDVFTTIRSLDKDFKGRCKADSTAGQVVRDLERLAETGTEIYRPFLHLIQEYLPGRIVASIESLARSDRESVRREGLIFAARSDAFVDAWLNGLTRKWEHMPDVLELSGDSEAGGIANQLVLALLRRYNRGDDREQIKAIIEGLHGELSSDYCALCLLALNNLPVEDYLSVNAGDRFLLAARAGAGDKLLRNVSRLPERMRGLDVPQVWLALSSLVPSAQRLTDILALDAPCRAVFGLCSAEEWSAIRLDAELERKVIDCRGRRLLSFTPSP